MISRAARYSVVWLTLATLLAPALFVTPSVAQTPGIPQATGFEFDYLPAYAGVSYNAVAWNPNGTYALIVGGIPGPQAAPEKGYSIVYRWDGSNLTMAYEGEGATLFDVAFHPDGSYALIIGHTNTIIRYSEDENGTSTVTNLWKTQPLGTENTFLGRGVGFKPDGSYALITGGYLMRYDDARGFLLVHSGENAIFKNVAWNDNSTFAFIDGSSCERQADGSCKIVLGTIFKYSDHKPFCDAHNQSTPCIIWTHNYGWFSPKFADVNDIVFAPGGKSAWIIGYDAGHGSTALWRWQDEWNDKNAKETPYQYFSQYHKEGKWSAMAWQPNGYKALIGAWTENQIYETDGGVFTKVIDNAYCKSKFNVSCPNVQDIAWHPSGTSALITATDGGIFRYAPDSKPWLIVREPAANITLTDDTRVVIDAYAKRIGAKIQRVEGRVDDRHTVFGYNERGPRWVIGDVKLPNFAPGLHELTVRAFDGERWTDNATIPFYVANTSLDALPTPQFKRSRLTEPTGTYTLRWDGNASATNYEWQESTEPLFRSARSKYATDSAIEVFNQVPGVYYYRVRAHGGRAASDWSATATVNVSRVAETQIPITLNSPQITSSETLSLTGQYEVAWTPVANATVYELQVASDGFFTKDLKALSTNENTFIEQAKDDGNYYYRVRARSNTEKSDWSPVFQVTVGEAQRTPAAPTTNESPPTTPPAIAKTNNNATPVPALFAVLALGAAAFARRRRT